LPSEESEGALEDILNRGYVFLTSTGRVAYWTARSREIIETYFPGQVEDNDLPMQLQAHLHRLTLRLKQDVAGNLAVFPITRGNAQLVIRFIQHPHTHTFLLLLEERSSEMPELSARELEVLEWIGEGKTNSEIAIILGISLHTVKRHAERIFAKLGVESRHAAALCALKMKQGPKIRSEIGLATYIEKSTEGLSAVA